MSLTDDTYRGRGVPTGVSKALMRAPLSFQLEELL
jgi:hypothetical protein